MSRKRIEQNIPIISIDKAMASHPNGAISRFPSWSR